MSKLNKRSGLLLALLISLSGLLMACGDNTATSAPATSGAATGTTASATTGAATVTTALAATTTTAATTAAVTAAVRTTQAAGTTTAAATTAASFTTAASGTPAASGSLTKLTLALDWVPNTNHTGIFVAQQKGWYKEAGIDLQILPYADGAVSDVLVGEGKADLGISGGDGVATYRAAGQPVVSLAAIIQHNTSGFAYLKDGNIKQPRDLAGKRYAGFGAAFEAPVIAAIIKKDGGTDTKFQNITANVAGYQAVAAKQADFVWIFAGWDGIQARLDNVNLGVFYLKDVGIPDFYTPVIISSDNTVKSKATALKAFMAATSKGYDFAIANPKEAADLLIAANPKGTFSNPELVYQSQAFLSPRYKDDAAKWGQQSLESWTGYQKFLFDNSVLLDSNGKPLTKELDYKQLFTNDFLP
jgi:ABC-type nitrate/sulfonate/bicarbonate transport system substrate-binding protein